MNKPWKGIIDKYRDYLPVGSETPVVSLHEGNTPLIYSCWLSELVGKNAEVYLKYEGMNPTGSFKDRGMTMAISKAVEEKSVAVLCASTGNTSASASAYAARARMSSIVLIPNGAIALGKLSQALIHGAKVAPIEANFDVCLELAKEIAERFPITLVNSINPNRIEGQKTCAFEICDALDGAPDFNITPVGNAGNITAQWLGYREYHHENKIGQLPRMLGFQAAGAAPLVHGEPVSNPETIATAIRIGNPASWDSAIQARDESGGFIDAVTDDEILRAYQLLAARDGVFVEPASAASVAGLMKHAASGYFEPFLREKEKVRLVCIVTGHGLKDPERAIKSIELPERIDPSVEAIDRAIHLTS